ncbi:hypothetical protein Q4567_01635 [Aliiglaciecola sp. 2_MG-2023]|uniref:hypothetical protein n=1 Tax=unclassified Aliiglaciecola TaxID=2593648 RepID=UPI0026E33168|nr:MULTISPECIES: hypothetical protein [unclassified Aliiglaciecola]MDO6709414.1 hypothetical protein [Aliiglaciecola sp. 2_MG-2023]MDO6750562.1 hypothetical protein [Aliiglaciecola sp. 1_MG-2023]
MLKAYAVALMLTTTPTSANLDGANITEQQKTVSTSSDKVLKPGGGIGFDTNKVLKPGGGIGFDNNKVLKPGGGIGF